MNKSRIWSFAALAICAVLYIIWPTAHTIAARKLLLVAGAFVGLVLLAKSEDRSGILKSYWFIFLGLLLAWVTFHAAFLSRNADAWGELRGQWLPAYLAVLTAIGLALASRHIDAKAFKIYLLSLLSAQTILYVLVSLYTSLQQGHLAIGYWGPDDVKLGTDLKTSLTINAELLAALSCAMLIESFGSRSHETEWRLWLALLVAALYVAFVSTSMNAILLMVAMLCIAMMLLAYMYRAKLSAALIAIVAITLVAATFAAAKMPVVQKNWTRALSNVRMAADVDANQQWKNIDPQGSPTNEMGELVPYSFYHRIARAKIGIRLAFENPLGYGVTRHAYQELVQAKYPEANMIASSEDGYINLVSAVGFPALILLLLAVISVYTQVYKSDSQWKRPIAWMMTISLAHFALDAIERDHFFEIYLFLLALSATMLTNTKEPR